MDYLPGCLFHNLITFLTRRSRRYHKTEVEWVPVLNYMTEDFARVGHYFHAAAFREYDRAVAFIKEAIRNRDETVKKLEKEEEEKRNFPNAYTYFTDADFKKKEDLTVVKRQLENARAVVTTGSKWKHNKKGMSCGIFGLAIRESDLKIMVQYEEFSDKGLLTGVRWDRPYEEFIERFSFVSI